jgi:putative ABC transport system permease protein
LRFLPLLLANLRRKKLRTALTLASFAVALFLFGLLTAIRAGFRQGIDVAGVDRLVVIGRTSLIQPLPMAYKDRLERVVGVKDVTYASWFGGIYQNERNFFAQFAIHPEGFRAMFPEFVLDAAQWRDLLADRQGCVAGAKLAKRFGWKLGDRIPIRGTIFEGNWEFNLRAIYRGRRPQDDESQFWLRSDYLYEKGPQWWRGLVGWYWVRLADPAEAARVAKTIDATFSNSPWETRTQTEKAFASSFMEQMGNVEFLILVIGWIVFLTLLLVTGNTMAIAVRERTGELAVLKAIGYSDRFVLGLVLAESLLIACVGGLVGLWVAHGLVSNGDLTQGLILLYLPPAALVAGAAFAIATGLLAGLLPAVGAMRLNVVDAMRRV